jgi:hypothetical protein
MINWNHSVNLNLAAAKMPPRLKCHYCWGRRQVLSGLGVDCSWEDCEHCNGTGVPPIPFCEVGI